VRSRSTKASARKSLRVPQSRLQEARADASADVVDDVVSIDEATVAALDQIEDGRFEPQPLGAAEQVAVSPVDPRRRPVHGGVLRRYAEGPGQALRDLDRERQVSVGIELLPLADAHGRDRLQSPDRGAHVRQRRGGIGVARLRVDE
jgi:hypothetical protein